MSRESPEFPWRSPAAAELIHRHAGPQAVLRRYDGPERFDVLNLLVATDSAVAELGADVRRLRPNILLGGVPAGAERGWAGKALAIGDAMIGILDLRQRCIVTTIDPDTGAQDIDVLLRIRDRFATRIALDCWVITPGRSRWGTRSGWWRPASGRRTRRLDRRRALPMTPPVRRPYDPRR